MTVLKNHPHTQCACFLEFGGDVSNWPLDGILTIFSCQSLEVLIKLFGNALDGVKIVCQLGNPPGVLQLRGETHGSESTSEVSQAVARRKAADSQQLEECSEERVDRISGRYDGRDGS